ncbi:hypothetical protein TrLO_g7835 [Triparma laevis f. longispina]|uniref:Uncharacterized protein n=1 Tax=Triparma laevis f. longispina TaxID=1714387 RepID=A0A9W7FNN5_9STRA|nr:hypothetical protein TrLO_g7835 [Triparma laevis f. longispina]
MSNSPLLARRFAYVPPSFPSNTASLLLSPCGFNRRKEPSDKLQAIKAVIQLTQTITHNKASTATEHQTKTLQIQEQQLSKALECLCFIKNESPEVFDAIAIGADVDRCDILKGVERVYPLLKRLNDSRK